MKKITKFMLCGALATTVLSGCGNNTKDNDKTTITFWHAMGGEQLETLKDLTKKFEKENPNIKVELQSQGDYSNLQAKLTTAQASPKTLPNITQAYGDWLEDSINNGKIKHLNIDSGQYVEEYVKPLIKDGKLYGVPFCKSTEVLVYNKTIVDKLGLNIPKTPQEYYDFCKTIYDKTKIIGGGFDHLGNFYQTYLKNKGVELNENTDLLSKESKESAKYLQKGVQNHAFRLVGADKYLSNAFGSEKVASYIGTNGGLSFMEKGVNGKFEYGVARSPMGKTIQQGTDLFVFKKDTKQDKASEKYLEFLTNANSQTEWGLNTGYIPTNKKALESEEYKNYKYANVLKLATSNLYTEPINSKRNRLYLASMKYLEKIANGTSVEQGLKEYQNERNQIFR